MRSAGASNKKKHADVLGFDLLGGTDDVELFVQQVPAHVVCLGHIVYPDLVCPHPLVSE